MPDVLNQDEVDALLDMVNSSGDSPEEEAPDEQGEALLALSQASGFNVSSQSDVHLYDFKRPERVSKEQVVALEALHEVFARNLSAALSGYLRTVIEVRLISVEQFTYSEFTMSLPSPTSINLLACEPLEGNMVLEINPSIIFPIIDRLLGGGTSEAYLLDRPFTNIELGLVNSILSRVLDQLTLTWENLKGVKFEIIESESNPFLMQILAPNELIVLLSFEVLMGEFSGMINLCIPFKVLEPILQEFSKSHYWFSPPEEDSGKDLRRFILENIADAEMNVVTILADLPLRLSDILTLKPGDIVDTGKPAKSEIIMAVEHEQKFLGRPGVSRSKMAFQITRAVERAPTISG